MPLLLRLLQYACVTPGLVLQSGSCPWRTDARFRLATVPTLVYWRDGTVASVLSVPLEQVASADAAAQLVKEELFKNGALTASWEQGQPGDT